MRQVKDVKSSRLLTCGGGGSSARPPGKQARIPAALAENAQTGLLPSVLGELGNDMIKAIRIHANGGPEALRWEDVELPPPGPGQAQVRQTAIGINYSDVNVRRGG